MFSLVYPPTPSTITGRRMSNRDELLPIVEPSGLVTGIAPRSLCHGGGMLLHPVVNLHIIDRQERILLQKRSASKHMWPHCWDTAVGGHIGYGEQPDEALVREADEELGLHDFNPVFLGTHVYENQRERELVALYAAIVQELPEHYGSEVEELRWWTYDEIAKASKARKADFTPAFLEEFGRISGQLLALL